MPESSDAKALAEALGKTTEQSIEIKGRSITIEPAQIDQILQMMICVERLAQKGLQLPGVTAFGLKSSTQVIQLLLRSGGDFKEFLAIAANPDLSKKDEEIAFIGSLNVLQAAQYAGLIWKVNKDFFVENQAAILAAFGLEPKDLEEITNTWASIKSLLTSARAESQTSEASPSEKSTPSPEPSEDNSATL